MFSGPERARNLKLIAISVCTASRRSLVRAILGASGDRRSAFNSVIELRRAVNGEEEQDCTTMSLLHGFAACTRHAVLLVALAVVAAHGCSSECVCARPGGCKAAEWDAVLDGVTAKDEGSAKDESTEVYVPCMHAPLFPCNGRPLFGVFVSDPQSTPPIQLTYDIAFLILHRMSD